MHDDLNELTRDERVQARADWRQLTLQDRRKACRLAKQGRAATDGVMAIGLLSWSQRRWGHLLVAANGMTTSSNTTPSRS